MPDTDKIIFDADIFAKINIDAAKAALDRLAGIAQNTANKMASSFEKAGQVMRDGAGKMGDALLNARAPAEQLANVFQLLQEHSGTWTDKAIAAAREVGKEFANVGQDIIKNWRDVPKYMFQDLAGTQMREALQSAIQKQTQYIRESMTAATPQLREAARENARAMFVEIQAIRQQMGAAGRDITMELANGIRMTKGAVSAGAWELAGELSSANEQMIGQMETLSTEMVTSTARISHALRELAPTTRESLTEVGRALQLLQSQNVSVAQSFGFLIGGAADLGKSIGLLSDRSTNFLNSISQVGTEFGRWFGRINILSNQTDLAILNVSRHIESTTHELKIQQGVLRRLFEQEEQRTKVQLASYKNQLALMEKIYYSIGQVAEAEKQSYVLTQEQTDALAKLGVQGVSTYASFEEKLKGTSLEVTKLENQLQSMTTSWRRHFSDLGHLLSRMETGAYHFGTTLQASGKISTDRIKDLRASMQNASETLKRMGEQGVQAFPGLSNVMQIFSRNIKTVGKDITELEAHERRLRQTTGDLGSSFLQANAGSVTFGNRIRNMIPFMRSASMNAQQMGNSVVNSFRGMGGGAERVIHSLSYSLGSIDPVFMEVTQGARMMGYGLGAVMTEMDTVAATKGARVVKHLNMIKLAAAGIIGVFGALIISTGKLAADVTTLEMTMRTVGENMGYSAEQVEMWRDGVKAMGITTRAATNAVTQFIRAKLPTEWYDPIQEATYSMEDLARTAQNLAVSVGEDSSQTFNRFIYFIQSGNSQLLDTIGIAKNASVMLEEYAKAVGKTTKTLSQREYYEALISGLMREGAQIQGVYEEAMKTANKQLGSMVRLLEEARYEWGKYFEPILAVAIKRFNSLLKLIAAVPENTKKTITTFVTILTALSGITLAIGVLLPKLKLLFKFMTVGLSSMLSPVGLLITAISLLGPKLLEMFSGFNLGKEGIEGMAESAGSIADKLLKIGETLKPLTDWLRDFGTMVSWHIERIAYRVGKIVELVKSRIQDFVTAHPEIMDFLERAKTVLMDLFSVIFRVVDKVLSAIEKLLDQDFEGFIENLREAAVMIGTWVAEFFNEIVKTAFEWGKNIISAFVSGIIAKARTAIPRAMSAVGTMIASFLEGHSPAKIGPLSTIDQWGMGLMGSFERGLRRKRILFDEDMFLGMATLNAKAKVWGDNVTTTFAQGIVGKAAGAIIPAMDYIGNIIAMFLEGHSPPLAGRLVEIEDWGRNAFETFLAGFQMADFAILDRALDLVGERISTLVGSTKEGAAQIAGAMMQVREAVAGAIIQARTTGGPLDLSGINQIISGSIRVMAADIADVLEANFAALQAQEAFQRLQASIAAARAARQKAIQAAQDALRDIQDAIKDRQKEMEKLKEQMLEEFETRAKAAGIWVDPKLMAALQREMERASVDVQRAQRRLQRVRDASSKYGINLLTWEEINAQAQLQLAERRQQEIQEQLWTQQELQRKAEELREKIAEEYEGRFEALENEIESLQKRAEAAQEHLEALQRANQAATAAENEQLAAAKAHADELANHAALMSKLLEERMKAEKDLAAIVADQADKTEETNEAARKASEDFSRLEGGMGKRPQAYREPGLSEMFEGALATFRSVFALENVLRFVQDIEEIIKGWWEDLKTTTFGAIIGETGIAGLIENIVTQFGEIAAKLGLLNEGMKSTGVQIGNIVGDSEGTVDAWTAIKDIVGGAVTFFVEIADAVTSILGGGIQILEDLSVLDITDPESWKRVSQLIGTDLGEMLGGVAGSFGDLINLFGQIVPEHLMIGGVDVGGAVTAEDLVESLDWIREQVVEWGKKIGVPEGWKKTKEEFKKMIEWFKGLGEALKKSADDFKKFVRDVVRYFTDFWNELKRIAKLVWDALVGLWEDIRDALIGHSIIPDLIDGIIDFFTSLPGELLQIGKDLFNAAVDLGKQIVDGLVSKLSEIKLGEWLSEKASAIGNAAATFLNKALELGGNIVVGISTKVTELGQKIGGWLIEKASNITGAAQSFLQNALTLGQNILSGISQKITDLGTSIAGWLITAAQNIGAASYSFLQRAKEVAQGILDGFYDAILGPYGLITKIADWLKGVASWITSEDSGILASFLSRAASIGASIMTGIRNGINSLMNWVGDVIKNIWNDGLRAKFQDIIFAITGAINGIIQMINDAADAVGLPIHLPLLIPPLLPTLDLGGIITDDTIAQLHAGEVVLPLDRLASVLRNANVQPVPAFAPVMNFYPGSNPQQVVPAIHQAYDWYIEELRRP